MRSVSLFLPPGLRSSGSRSSHGPSSKVGPAPRPESGVGIVLDQTEDGRLVVAHVWPGSPAAAAGICLGDVLLLIDGMQGSVSSMDVAKDLILGEEGTAVTLQVLRGITQLEFGPIVRHSWVTIQQMDTQLQRLRQMGQQESRCNEIYASLVQVRRELEKEREQFQEAVIESKQYEQKTKDTLRKLEQALIDVTESSNATWHEAERREREHEQKASEALLRVMAAGDAAHKRVQQLECDYILTQQKVGNSEVKMCELEQRAVSILNAFETLPTPRGRLAAFTLKHLSSHSIPRKTASISSMSTEDAGAEPSQENMKEQLREIFGEQAYRLRNALVEHNTYSQGIKGVVLDLQASTNELAGTLEVLVVPGERAKASKNARKSKKKKALEPACSVVDMIDGWKEAKPANGSLPFWYNERTQTVTFRNPRERNTEGQTSCEVQEPTIETFANDLNTATDCDILTQTDATQSLAITGVLRDKMRNDSITCNGENIPARRATFGRHISISGQAAITDPFLADTELRNKELIRGKIAVIGRGNTQFIHKAQVAVEAGAIGVIFVNTKKRLFDAIHSGNEVGINIPVVTVGLLAQEHLTDGAELTLNLDSAYALGSAAELERQTLAASMLDIETDRSNIVRVGQTYRASGGKVEAAGRASSTRAVLVGGQIPPLTGGSEFQAQTTGRASMCSQAMTEDSMSVDRLSVISRHTNDLVPSSAEPTQSLIVQQLKNSGTRAQSLSVGASDARMDGSTTESQLQAYNEWLTYGGAAPRRSSKQHKVAQLVDSARWNSEVAEQGLDQLSADALRISETDLQSNTCTAPTAGNGLGPAAATQAGDMTAASKTETKYKDDRTATTGEGDKKKKKKNISTRKVSLYRRAYEKVGNVPLPPGWNMRISRSLGEVLYYCTATGERRWTPPPFMQGAVSPLSPRSVSSRPSQAPMSPDLGPTSALLSSRAYPLSPVCAAARPQSALSNFTQNQLGLGDEMSVFSGGSQADPRSPTLHSIKAEDDTPSEMISMRSPDGEGMVIPPWPDDLKSTISKLARILIEGRQIVCTRAEFGLQADPEKANMVVRGKVVRAVPWQAQHDLENAEDMKGAIALIGRGGCQFTEKARRAQEAGAVAVVIANHSDLLFNVLGQMRDMKLPVVSITKQDAESLIDGAAVALQWGEGLGPIVTPSEAESNSVGATWAFKMTSKVGFSSSHAHLPTGV